MSRRASLAVLAMMAFPAVLAAQQSNPVSDAFRSNAKTEGTNLMAAMDQFPVDKLTYKPTPAQMSVAQIMAHLAQGNDFFCGSIGGVKPPVRTKIAATASKEALMARLRETFAFCDQALANVSDANLAEELPFFGGRKMSRAAIMTITTGDWADHYSQAAIYLRLLGMLPQTAKKPAAE